jgi:hypothetical protein
MQSTGGDKPYAYKELIRVRTDVHESAQTVAQALTIEIRYVFSNCFKINEVK